MTPEELREHVGWALTEAHEGRSKLDAETLAMGGFATPFQRRLVNNLCSGVKEYLEVGLFRGATFCAAACNNHDLNVTGVENFAQPFGQEGVEQDLKRNIEITRPKTGGITLVESDCWSVKPDITPRPVDFFYYDGEHGTENTAKALPFYLPVLADTFILMFDDTSWDTVSEGIKQGFERCRGKIKNVGEWVYAVTANEHPLYWNGVNLYVCKKV